MPSASNALAVNVELEIVDPLQIMFANGAKGGVGALNHTQKEAASILFQIQIVLHHVAGIAIVRERPIGQLLQKRMGGGNGSSTEWNRLKDAR